VMLCHVIGFTDFEHHGIQGVEGALDDYLRGQDGYRYIEHNRAGQELVLYRGQERAQRNGYQVHLTIDLNLQNIVENELDAAMHDHAAFTDLSVKDILVKSSNIGAAKLAVSLGDQKFYEYIRRFGFGERTGIELPGEIPGLIRSPQSWSKISITHIPMGHEIGVTPLQMTAAMCAIANGGKLMTPRIVKSITTSDGKTVSSLSPIALRQVISAQTANQIGSALRGVVS